ncbi:MAG: hypothetical protein EHM77_07830 [Planctomycetaceae bacterium]|nr:MAG: hypothetical protein EHM77_07830 [Planctomycetaceae bacterium]
MSRSYSIVGSTLAVELPQRFRPLWDWRTVLPFLALVLFIASVSVHDAALVAVNQDVIYEMEQNPLGRWLIALDSGSVSLFILVKMAGTAVVCAVLGSLFEYSRRLGFAVAWPIAIFQGGLLAYLYTH